MTLLFFYLAFLSYLPFKGLFAFLLFYLSKVFFTFKKQVAHGGFYSYINQ